MLDEWKNFKMQDFRNLRDLLQLLRENEASSNISDSEEEENFWILQEGIEAESSEVLDIKDYELKSLVFPPLTKNTYIWVFVKQTKNDKV